MIVELGIALTLLCKALAHEQKVDERYEESQRDYPGLHDRDFYDY